jgi:flagellar hook-associated protein 1 FlgK
MAFSLLSVGARAMSANYAALQTTSNNIANASVAGYSRQQANLQTTAGQPTGSGFLGTGVDVASITRAHDAFLTREAATATSQAKFDSTHLELLTQLEDAFPTGDAGVGQAASNFFSALSDLASNPADTSARQVVLSRAGDLAQRFSSAGQQLDSLQSGVGAELRGSVDGINGITSRLAQLNNEIVGLQARGQSPNDLLDQRDRLVQQLSGFLQVSTIASADGALSVFAAGGQRLVLGGEAQKLEVTADKLDGSRASVSLREADGSERPLDSALLAGGGSVGALLKFQNEDLVSARNTLGQMATALAARTNQQQARGLDLGNPSGPGQALFTDFVQQSLSGGLKALPASGNTLTSVEIHIGDASLLEADEYTLEAQADGSFVMTRASDGASFSTQDGSTFTRLSLAAGQSSDYHPGFTLQLNGTAAAGDRFLVQPVGQAAAQMERVLSDPKGVAAAAPATAVAAAANKGTGAVAGLTVTSDTAAVQAKLPGRLTFTDDAGAYTWTQTDAAGNAVGTPQTGQWVKGQALELPGGLSLQLSGQPKQADVFNLAVPVAPGGNNGNAKALAVLGSETLVGRSWSASGNTGGASITNAYASALSSVGTRVQSAQTASDISIGVATEAVAQRDNRSGVDIDEEGARLIEYQKSYQAAAKVLQMAQSVFDTLLQAISG